MWEGVANLECAGSPGNRGADRGPARGGAPPEGVAGAELEPVQCACAECRQSPGPAWWW